MSWHACQPRHGFSNLRTSVEFRCTVKSCRNTRDAQLEFHLVGRKTQVGCKVERTHIPSRSPSDVAAQIGAERHNAAKRVYCIGVT